MDKPWTPSDPASTNTWILQSTKYFYIFFNSILHLQNTPKTSSTHPSTMFYTLQYLSTPSRQSWYDGYTSGYD